MENGKQLRSASEAQAPAKAQNAPGPADGKKYTLLKATFPYGGFERKECRRWLERLAVKVHDDRRWGKVYDMEVDDTPITMSRNRVCKQALELGADFVLMVDSDMDPDAYLGSDPLAKPFYETTVDFMLAHDGPCAVAAPYCGPPPNENVYVFTWRKFQSGHPNVDLKLDQFTREEAAFFAGIQEAAALPTGIFMMHTEALKSLRPPWFEYEYEDEPYRTRKSSTEDVFFTRNLSLAGVPQYCNWDAWAGHMKYKSVGKPQVLTADQVRDQFREALLRGRKLNERQVFVRPEGVKF